jgi:hypothetical protein
MHRQWPDQASTLCGVALTERAIGTGEADRRGYVRVDCPACEDLLLLDALIDP